MAKPRGRKRTTTPDVMKEMNDHIDRAVERRVRAMWIQDGGRLRTLTEREVRIAVRAGRLRADGGSRR